MHGIGATFSSESCPHKLPTAVHIIPEGNVFQVGKISEYEVLHLEPATSYSFRVAAHNGVS